MELQLRRGTQYQQCAIKTPLGWSLFGRQVTTNNTQKESVYSINRINIVQNDDLIHNSVKQFCEYEECINSKNQEIGMPMNNMNCLKKSTKETKFTNGKYKSAMLWKETCKKLPEHYNAYYNNTTIL